LRINYSIRLKLYLPRLNLWLQGIKRAEGMMWPSKANVK